MELEGIHHVTGITGDGQRCLDFYSGILGLGFVGLDRDFEAPDSHLIQLGRIPGRAGGLLSFIEAPGIRRGRPGNGMIHRLSWTVRSAGAVAYWADRLAEAGIEVRPARAEGGEAQLRFTDPEGIDHELIADPAGADAGFALGSWTVPAEHAIVGLAGVRAYGRQSVPSADIIAGRLGFQIIGRDSYAVGMRGRPGAFAFDEPPAERGVVGAGTIHHVAWAAESGLPAWRQRVIGMGCRATPVIDRGHCRSIYFREPSGVLFEIAAQRHERVEPVAARPVTGRGLSPQVDPRLSAAIVG